MARRTIPLGLTLHDCTPDNPEGIDVAKRSRVPRTRTVSAAADWRSVPNGAISLSPCYMGNLHQTLTTASVDDE